MSGSNLLAAWYQAKVLDYGAKAMIFSGGELMEIVFGQILSISFFVFIVFFLINIVDFMKKKSKNDEKIVQLLGEISERLPETKAGEPPTR